jgi:DoxX-like protein
MRSTLLSRVENHTEAGFSQVTTEAGPRLVTDTPTAPASRKRLWAGRIISALVALFLLFDGAVKVMKLAPVVEGSRQLGFSEGAVFGIGLIALVCLVAYLIPRTAGLGAILLTGYLGGAIATHVRVGSPLFTHTLFPIYVAALIWGGLYLRDGRLRALIAPPQ